MAVRIIYLVFFSIIIFNFDAQVVIDFTTPGIQTWVCPPNVSQITVQCWGGGGGGGNSPWNSNNGGSGGGGGAFASKTINVSQGNTYFLNIGAGGAGAPSYSNIQAANGGDSWFNILNTSPINNSYPKAGGGLRGLNNSISIPVNGGSLSQSFGDLIFQGGNGYAAYGSGGGGGGASGTSQGPGINATGINGAMSNGFGGNGGNASTSSSVNGQPGLQPGGGGGGSDDWSGSAGGNGGNGMVRISYFQNCTGTPSTPIISSNSMSGCGALTLWTNGFANIPGLVFQWQMATSLTGPWSNIANSNVTSLAYNCFSDTYFRLQVTCSFSAQTSTSNVIYYDFISNPNLTQPSNQNLTVSCGQNLTINATGNGNGYVWTSNNQDSSFTTSSNSFTLNSVNNDTVLYLQSYINPPSITDTVIIDQVSQLINFTTNSCSGTFAIQGTGNIGFGWTDNTPSGVTVTSFKILLNVGVECFPASKVLQINQLITSGLVTNLNCTCIGGNQYEIILPTTSLNLGGINQFIIQNPNSWLGLTKSIPGFLNYFAKILVTYSTNQNCVSPPATISIVSQTPSSAGTVSSNQSICQGQAPQNLTFNGLQGSIIWQQSSDSLVWTDVVGANTSTFNITANLGALTSTKWFRVKLSNPGCVVVFSNNVKVKVNPIPVIIASNPSTTICAGSSVNLIVTGANTYSWSPATGLNTNLGSSVVAAPMSSVGYTVVGTDQNGCSSSVILGVTVLPVAQGGTIGPQASYCIGTIPSNMTVSGQQGTIQWQFSYDNQNWSNFVGSTGSTLFGSNIGSLSQTTYIRVVTNLNNCGAAYSNVVPLTVFQPTIAGTVTSSQSICSGSLPSQLIVAGYVGNSFQWQYSTNNSTWNNISGATNDTLSSSQMAFLGFAQNYYFRVRVNNGPCSVQNSNSILVTVVSPASPGSPTAPQTICIGSNTPSISVSTSSGTLQWETAPSSSGPWTPITGATNSILLGTQIGSLTQTTFFRLAASNPACGTNYSVVTSIIVNQLAVGGLASSNQNICTGTSPAALTLVGGVGSIQWQSSSNNSIWSNIAGANTSSLSSSQMGVLTSNIYYRAFVSSGSCSSAISNSILVTVLPIPIAGVVSAAQTICTGSQPLSLSVNGTIGSLQWQYSNDNVLFTPITGANSNFLPSALIGTLSANAYFRIEASNSPCTSVFSNSVLITVVPTSNPGTISSNQTICTGTQPAPLTAVGTNGTLQWQFSTDNSTWVNIAGATTAMLSSAQMGTLTATRYYRLVSTNGVCPSVFSSSVVITVSSNSSVGSISANQSVCSGNLPININLSSFNGAIQWEVASTSTGPFLPIGNGTNPLSGAQIGPITSNKFIRAKVTNQACSSVLSGIHSITVLSLPNIDAGQNQSICQGDSLILNATGGATYQWSNGIQNGQWFIPSTTMTYSVTGTGSNGCSSIDQLTINIIPIPNITLQYALPSQICPGQVYTITASSTSSVVYQWYLNNSLISGVFSNVLQVNQQGSYSVKVTSNSNGCSNFSSPVSLVVLTQPTLSVSGDTMICSGESTVLAANSNANNIIWNGNQNQSTIQVSPIITTSYYVEAIGSNGCSNSETVSVEVHYSSDTTIYLSSYGPFNMGGQIFNESGIYTVNLNSIYGCDSVVTLNLNVIFNSIEDQFLDEIKLTNPVQNGHLILYGQEAKKIEIIGIHDLLGRVIEYQIDKSYNDKIILSFSLPSGMYMISIRKDNITINKQFIVAN